jgi:hypothetical protein
VKEFQAAQPAEIEPPAFQPCLDHADNVDDNDEQDDRDDDGEVG